MSKGGRGPGELSKSSQGGKVAVRCCVSGGGRVGGAAEGPGKGEKEGGEGRR